MPATMTMNEPLDPFLADAMRRGRRRPAAQEEQPSGQQRLLETLAAALFEKIGELPAEMILRMMAARAKANEPMSPMDEAQLEHTRALTAATKAQTANRAEEDDTAAQLRKLAVAETVKTGDMRGAMDIAEKRIEPGSAPAIMDRARESLAGRAAAARQRAESAFASNPAQAVEEYAGTVGGLMDQARRSHPGAGERIARDIGEEANAWMYERDVPETPPPARSWWTGQPVQERSQPGQAAAEELRQTLIRSILTNKERQFGRGQAGVTPEEIGGHFDAKRRAWRTF
ncbi:MAG: hypothetical protein AMXMBFR47_13760 [Planctomycetota bacterium]